MFITKHRQQIPFGPSINLLWFSINLLSKQYLHKIKKTNEIKNIILNNEIKEQVTHRDNDFKFEITGKILSLYKE